MHQLFADRHVPSSVLGSHTVLKTGKSSFAAQTKPASFGFLLNTQPLKRIQFPITPRKTKRHSQIQSLSPALSFSPSMPPREEGLTLNTHPFLSHNKSNSQPGTFFLLTKLVQNLLWSCSCIQLRLCIHLQFSFFLAVSSYVST